MEEGSSDLAPINPATHVPPSLLLNGLKRKRKLFCKYRVNLEIYQQSFPPSDKDPKGSSHLDSDVKCEDISELRRQLVLPGIPKNSSSS